MLRSMRRRLILLRHGDALWPSDGQNDRDRPLSATGRRQVATIAEALKQRDWLPEKILSSPATRAYETTQAILATHDVSVEVCATLYEGALRDVQQLLREISADVHTLLLVGHNPTFSHLAGLLTGLRISLSPANATLLTSDDDWNHAALLDSCWSLEKHLVPG